MFSKIPADFTKVKKDALNHEGQGLAALAPSQITEGYHDQG